MKILSRFLSLCLFFLSHFFSLGQKKKSNEGYFITPLMDTVSCTFKDRNWKKQPCEFRITINNRDSVLFPENVLAVFIASRELKYASRIIKPAKYIDNIQNATNNRDPVLDTSRNAFIKSLHEGTLNLYLYYDKLSSKHFFVENKDNFLEIYSHYYSDFGGARNSQPVAVQNKYYEFALKVLMTPCRSLFSIIENIGLNEEQLIQLFKMYDRCIKIKNIE